MGFLDQEVDALEDPEQQYAANAHVSGKRGGHTINLHRLARDGMRLVGKIEGTADGRLSLADDLHANLANADQVAADIRQSIDEYIAGNGIEAPQPDPSDDYDGADGSRTPLTRQLDLAESGVSTVVWATGYRPGFDWIALDVTDARGRPVHQRGVTAYPGLYFLGLSWLHKANSGLLHGVGEDAAYTVEHLTVAAREPGPPRSGTRVATNVTAMDITERARSCRPRTKPAPPPS